ncbi:uncharacterized protein LOC105695216 [Orussus abietinus]|uniref:uncharacterized protein LOC105695216 n=1 Tax=Orussus abietinus TaxID=222816 RepID=UPI000625B856|nr:uncharacterized protein LOC105695216 [Orussus abietinus]
MPINKGLLILQERVGPTGTPGQRRPSRSPRSQRSRSADVDCLKKYAERRVEERRHTEIADTTKLDPSKWIPLPRSISKSQNPNRKQSSQAQSQEETEDPKADSSRWIPILSRKISPKQERRDSREAPEKQERPVSKQLAARSQSTDVNYCRKPERCIEERRHTDFGEGMDMNAKWLNARGKDARYDVLLARNKANQNDGSKNGSTRWMTFTKNPSPCPMPKRNLDRKTSVVEIQRRGSVVAVTMGERLRETKIEDTSDWQPSRKFSSQTSRESDMPMIDEDQPVDQDGQGQKSERDVKDVQEDGVNPKGAENQADADKASSIDQRIKELYDFKTENEWPVRLNSPAAAREITRADKKTKEERYVPKRRNSQDLEFNDRMGKTKDSTSCRKDEKLAAEEGDVFEDDKDERMRRFHERLRFSEDLGEKRAHARARRVHSDDYDERHRISLTDARKWSNEESCDSPVHRESKRNSDVSAKSKDSKISYAEIDFSKRNSRTSDSSSASYATISQGAKRGSMDYKPTKQVELPPRRAFSQTEERPSTPIPPIEFNDSHPADKIISMRHKGDNSTRYKVYLT